MIRVLSTWIAGTALAWLGAPALAQATAQAQEPTPASRSFAPAPAAPETQASRRDRVTELVELKYSQPAFDLHLELSTGRLLDHGQQFDVTARVDRPAVLFLLNIDPTGRISVLYPLRVHELRPTSRLHETFEVVAPYGSEVLKLFAFQSLPQGLEHWVDRQIEALDPEFDELLQLLKAPGVESGQATIQVVTVNE